MSFNTRAVRQQHAKAFTPTRDSPWRTPEGKWVILKVIYHFTTTPDELENLITNLIGGIGEDIGIEYQEDQILSVSQDGWIDREYRYSTELPVRWFRSTTEGDYDAARLYVGNY